MKAVVIRWFAASGCRQPEPGVGALGRRSAHRRPSPGTRAAFAGPARRLR